MNVTISDIMVISGWLGISRRWYYDLFLPGGLYTATSPIPVKNDFSITILILVKRQMSLNSNSALFSSASWLRKCTVIVIFFVIMFDNHFNCNRHHCPLFETCDCFATAKDPHVSIVTCEHKFAEEQDIAGISYFLSVIILQHGVSLQKWFPCDLIYVIVSTVDVSKGGTCRRTCRYSW